MRSNRVATMFIVASALILGSSGVLTAQAAPAGATAKCVDGTYSKTKTKQGACSKHKGVAEWYGTGGNAAATPAPAAPASAPSAAPAGATARCNDGSYSTAKTRSGACSKHGGVAEWLAGGAAPEAGGPAEAGAPPSGAPQGATAICNDGTYSNSQHRSGTCSHHGGVKQWLKQVPK